MQQRRLRLGDIVDDYCPRERRITNHAIVAMIEDEVKQTRCTTCDADHEYKQARVPAQRKKKEVSALEGPFADGAHVRAATDADGLDQDMDDVMADGSLESAEHIPSESGEAAPLQAQSDESSEEPRDDGPVHRRLIRATLPRVEGQVPERKAPDFTVRQQGQRGSRFEHPGDPGNGGRPRHQRGGRGQQASPGNGPQRFGGQRQGHGQGGQRQNGNRPGMPGASRPGRQGGGQGRGGGRKRGR